MCKEGVQAGKACRQGTEAGFEGKACRQGVRAGRAGRMFQQGVQAGRLGAGGSERLRLGWKRSRGAGGSEQ